MRITVHLAPQVARELRLGSAGSAATQEVVSLTKELGIELRPMHPDSMDSGMASTFAVDATDEETAKHLVSRFQDLQATEAAYVKPPPAMP